jgi:hypothetical protein
VGQIFEDIEPGDALLGQECRGSSLRLLEYRRDQIADLCLLPLGALHVKDGGLKRAPERGGLLRFAFLAARQRLGRFVDAVADIASQQWKIRTTGRENPLAVGVVHQGIEQVLEREVRMAPRDRFAKRDVQDDFDSSRKHQTSSMVARSGNPASLARDATLSALVSATSQG